MYNKNKGEFDYNNKINGDSLDILKNLDIDVNTGSYSKRPVANDTTPFSNNYFFILFFYF